MAKLRTHEEALVLASVNRHREQDAGRRLTGASSASPRYFLVVSGWAGRFKLSRDGRRQLLSTVLPGEMFVEGAHAMSLASYPLMSLTSISVMDITALHLAVQKQPEDYPVLSIALSKALLQEQSRLLEQVARLGKSTAHERVGHWLLEIKQRLDTAGLSMGSRFPMPLTQELIGAALGLSIVHVNRIIQQLRSERLIEMKARHVTLLDLDRLVALTDYAAVEEEPRSFAPTHAPQERSSYRAPQRRLVPATSNNRRPAENVTSANSN